MKKLLFAFLLLLSPSLLLAQNKIDLSRQTKGILPANNLPAPTASTIGGVKSIDCTGLPGHIFKIDTTGLPVCSVDAGLVNPMTTLGDLLYGGASGAATRLPGDVTNARKFLRTQSSAGVAAAPVWDLLVSGDIPNNAANTTGNAGTATALAATPTACTLPQVEIGIAANGNGICSQPSNVTGNAATATALASTPTQCGGNNFSTGVAASGNANCAQPSSSNLSDNSTLVKNGVDINSSNQVTATHLSAALPVAQGGTNGATAAAARGSNGLNVDELTSHGDSAYSIVAADRVVGTNAALTAPRTWTLPAANSVNAGADLIVADIFGGVTASNTLTVARAGSDTINGSTSVQLTSAYSSLRLVSDGVSKWSLDGTQPFVAPANQFVTGLNSSGQMTSARPSFPNLSGAIAASQTPLTTRGDLLTLDNSGALVRLGIGGANVYPKSNGLDLVYSTLAAAGIGPCTNQVVTALNADGAPTCSTVTSAMVDSSISATPVGAPRFMSLFNYAPLSPVSPGSIAVGANTVTLVPVPKGLNGSDTNHHVHIAGTGVAEDVLITGGTAVAGSGSGTITFTAANVHAAGYTISSSTAGLEEAYNDAPAGGSVAVEQFDHTMTACATFTKTITVYGYDEYGSHLTGDGGDCALLKFKGTKDGGAHDIRVSNLHTVATNNPQPVNCTSCTFAHFHHMVLDAGKYGLLITSNGGLGQAQGVEADHLQCFGTLYGGSLLDACVTTNGDGVSLASLDMDIHDNFAADLHTSGILGPPHDYPEEDCVRCNVHHNVALDYNGFTETNASAAMLYANHVTTISDSKLENNIFVYLGTTPTFPGLTGLTNNHNYFGVSYSRNIVDGYKGCGSFQSENGDYQWDQVKVDDNQCPNTANSASAGLFLSVSGAAHVQGLEVARNFLGMTGTGTASGIRFDFVNRAVLADNTVENSGGNGVLLQGSSNNSIYHNHSYNNGQNSAADAFRLNSLSGTGSSNNSFQLNDGSDFQLTPTQKRGINNNDSTNNIGNFYAGNNLFNNVTAPLTDVAASARFGINNESGTGAALDTLANNTTGTASNITSILATASFPALTGDITTVAGALATTLKNTGTAGTYYKTTFDAQGRETSGASSLVSGDIPNNAANTTGSAGSISTTQAVGTVLAGPSAYGAAAAAPTARVLALNDIPQSVNILNNSIITSSVDANGNPNFLTAGAGATINVNGGTTSLTAIIGGQYQVLNSNLSVTAATPGAETENFVLLKQDTANANSVAGDLVVTSCPVTVAKTKPSACGTVSGSNLQFWFDLSTNLMKSSTDGSTFSTNNAILLGVVAVSATPTVDAVAAMPFRLNPYRILNDFKDGSNAALSLTSGTTTHDGEFHYTAMMLSGATLNSTNTGTGSTVDSPGQLLYVQTPVLMLNSSTITEVGLGRGQISKVSGACAAGSSAGYGGSGGGSGGAAATNAGCAGGNHTTLFSFGNGAGGSAGAIAGAGGAGNSATQGWGTAGSVPTFVDLAPYMSWTGAAGANGGGDGTTGDDGQGGGGGGVAAIKAPSVNIVSGSTMNCNGGAAVAAAGTAGGGGGGGGGACALVTFFSTNGTTGVTAAGGVHGNAIGGSGAGGDGGAGVTPLVIMQ